MKFYFECPYCGGKFETEINVEDYKDVIGCTFTCNGEDGCGKDPIITGVELNEEGIPVIKSEKIEYDYFIDVDEGSDTFDLL